jgi:hypothetical protein
MASGQPVCDGPVERGRKNGDTTEPRTGVRERKHDLERYETAGRKPVVGPRLKVIVGEPGGF